MSPEFVVGIFAVLVLWADRLIRRNSPSSSPATLIPLAWILIAGSRPVSTWFDSSSVNSVESLTEGSPMDRGIYQLLIFAAVIVLMKRRFSFVGAARHHGSLAAYFAFLLLASLWSADFFLSSKRWVKDFGNVLIVLVLLTEKDPLEAARTVMLRSASVLIPASLLLIKYFPEYSRYYDVYLGRAYFSGAALDKNMLGMSVTALLLFVVWTLLEQRDRPHGPHSVALRRLCLGLLMLGAWLLKLADCATALVACSIGLAMLVLLRMEAVRRHPLGAASLVGSTVLLANMTGVLEELQAWAMGSLQRNASLTGRTDIWRIVLEEDTNPWIGAGAYTFWTPERMERLSHGYLSAFNSAHNGFLDIYLNVGLIGVGLLVLMLLTAWVRAARSLRVATLRCSSGAALVFLTAVAIFAVTEAVFNRLNLLWIGVLIFCLCFAHDAVKCEAPARPATGRHRP